MKYTGGCHCGNVRYEVETEIKDLLVCNCSICQKKGAPLSFAPASAFTLTTPEDALGDYQFGKKHIHHLFCKTCGIHAFGKGAMPDGTQMVALNVRCLDNVDVSQFPVQEYDGKSL